MRPLVAVPDERFVTRAIVPAQTCVDEFAWRARNLAADLLGAQLAFLATGPYLLDDETGAARSTRRARGWDNTTHAGRCEAR